MAFLGSEALAYLRRAHDRGRLGHAYLVTGPEGSGKRTLCEALCALVNPAYARGGLAAAGGDVQVIEPESKSRRILVAQVRELERALQLTAAGEGRKVGVIRDADRMQPQAANAFLKTLEEPPGSVLFLLVTREPQALLETIVSRCVPVPLRRPLPGPGGEEAGAIFDLIGPAFEGPVSPGPGEAVALARRFLGLLARARAEIKRRHEEELAAEKEHYARTTDSSWLAEREERLEAIIESDYIRHRARLVDALCAWWAEVLRRQHDAGEGEGSRWERVWKALAGRLTVSQVLRRLEAAGDLREHLDRNVQESLAVEVGFLRSFAE